MTVDDKRLLGFLGPQMRTYGGKVEVEPGVWVLFAVETADEESNKLALWLLAGARFASDSGPSEDDRWTLYFVSTANREEAVHWLDETVSVASGLIRPVSPAQRALIGELASSGMPHRVAQQLAEQHARGKLTAGCVRDEGGLRALLDRLHYREPAFFSALQTLLQGHLIDLIAFRAQLIAEDISVEDEIGRTALSRSPFPEAGRAAADEIRAVLTSFRIINPVDQGTNIIVTNPYAAYLEIVRDGDRIMAQLHGKPITLARAILVEAVRATRRNLYWGSEFSKIDTQAPWMRDEIADSFRFIKQRLESRRDVSALDGLYMLERAVED